MRLLFAFVVFSVALLADEIHAVERLTDAEYAELQKAEAEVRQAENRLIEVRARIRHNHGYTPVATGRCETVEVVLWKEWALKTTILTCGLTKPQQQTN